MNKFILVCTFLLLLFIGTFSNSQWGSSCIIAQPASVESKVQSWEYFSENNTDAILLYEGRTPVGLWHYKDNYWCDYDAKTGKWGPKLLEPRVEPPLNTQYPRHYFGVIREDNYGCTRKGSKISIQDAHNIMDAASDRIIDNSKLLHITIISADKNEREKIAEAYSKLEPETLRRLTIWKGPPDHWALRDNDSNLPIFDTTAKLNIYFTEPNGKVIFRQEDFDGEASLVALRKGIKNYDKSKDPDLRKPEPLPKPNPLPPDDPAKPNPISPIIVPDVISTIPWVVWVVLGVGVVFVLINNKELVVDLLRKIPQTPEK